MTVSTLRDLEFKRAADTMCLRAVSKYSRLNRKVLYLPDICIISVDETNCDAVMSA